MKLLNSNVLVAVLGTSILVGLIVWGLFWNIDEITVEPPPVNQPPVLSQSVDLVGRQDGKRRWRLLSEQVEMQAGQQVFENGAHGYFYGESDPQPEGEEGADVFFADRDQMQWQAGHARYDATADQLLLQVDVQVNGQDGSQLLTNSLKVTPEEQIEVPEPFTLKGDDIVLSGDSGSFNFQFAVMTATKGQLIVLPAGELSQTSATDPLLIASSDPDATTIIADNLQYDRNTQIAAGEGNLVIHQEGVEIRAPQGIYQRKQAQSILSGGVTLRDPQGSNEADSPLADLTLAQAESENPEDQEVTIVADKLTYDRNTQVAQGEGNLEIQQGETVILAPTGSYKRKESQSILTGGVTLKEPKRILKSDRLTGNHKDKIFLFEDNVIYTQLAEDASAQASADAPLTDEIRRAETEVKAVKLIYNSRTGVSEFTDQVEFVQKGRQAKSNQATITPEKVTLSGDVAIEQIQGDWLAKRFDDPEAQADVAKPTLIFADRVEIDQATSDARFFDNVVIVQPNRAAEGDSAIYTDSKQTFELLAQKAPVLLCDRADTAEVVADSIEGLPGRDALDVTCRGATRISSQLITLDVANDTFSATGTESSQSQMTFRVSDEIAPK